MKDEIYQSNLDYHEIGNRIRKYRTKAGLTQAQLAEMVNTSGAHLSKMELGVYRSYFDVYVAIATALNISLEDLLEGQISIESKSGEQLLLERYRRLSLPLKKIALGLLEHLEQYK